MTEPQNGGMDDGTPLADLIEATSANMIVTMRVYDVLMGLLSHFEPDMHRAMLEKHANGEILGPVPAIRGIFETDELNSDSTSSADAEWETD